MVAVNAPSPVALANPASTLRFLRCRLAVTQDQSSACRIDETCMTTTRVVVAYTKHLQIFEETSDYAFACCMILPEKQGDLGEKHIFHQVKKKTEPVLQVLCMQRGQQS